MAYLDLPVGKRELIEEILTERQLQVLRYRMSNVPWRTIAATLHLEVSTVKGHWDAALLKLEKQPLMKERAA